MAEGDCQRRNQPFTQPGNKDDGFHRAAIPGAFNAVSQNGRTSAGLGEVDVHTLQLQVAVPLQPHLLVSGSWQLPRSVASEGKPDYAEKGSPT